MSHHNDDTAEIASVHARLLSPALVFPAAALLFRCLSPKHARMTLRKGGAATALVVLLSRYTMPTMPALCRQHAHASSPLAPLVA